MKSVNIHFQRVAETGNYYVATVGGNRRMGSLHETHKKYVRKYTTCIREVLVSSVESVPRLQVSCQLLTMESLVQSEDSPYGINHVIITNEM
jgi:hypothetical protein